MLSYIFSVCVNMYVGRWLDPASCYVLTVACWFAGTAVAADCISNWIKPHPLLMHINKTRSRLIYKRRNKKSERAFLKL